MAFLDNLRTETRETLDAIDEVDIVVGIPSYNNSKTIGHVVRAVNGGLSRHFPEQSALIINSDGGSADGTSQAVMDAHVDPDHLLLVKHPLFPVHRITTPYHGLPGKGSSFRTIFSVAERLGAKGVAVVDSDLRSITPDWVNLLLHPIIHEEFDYVAPYYRRHKYDGTITNSIVYPLTRTLYGRVVRQPIGGEFGLSSRIIKELLRNTDVWETDVARYGIDIWMTTQALAGGFKVCQTFLGAKIHDPKDPGSDLSAMLTQVVGSLFGLMEEYEDAWKKVIDTQPTKLFGFPHEVGLEAIQVDPSRVHQSFQQGTTDLLPVYQSFLPEPLVGTISNLAAAPLEGYRMEYETWCSIIYHYAAAYHKITIDRKHLLQSLTPLYLGWVASFILRTRDMNDHQAEDQIEAMCRVYQDSKSDLIRLWDE